MHFIFSFFANQNFSRDRKAELLCKSIAPSTSSEISFHELPSIRKQIASSLSSQLLVSNFAKFLRIPFLQNTSGRLLLAFQKQPPEALYEKRCSWKFRKFHRKPPLVCEIFKNTFFYGTPLDDCFWLFRATLLKWGTGNSVWKTSDEYSLSSTIQVSHFFFQQDKLSVYVFIG